MKTGKRILSAFLAMMLVIVMASCGTDKDEPSSPDESINISQGEEVVTTDPITEETEEPSEEVTGYEDLETNETEDRLGWVVSGDYGAVNMFLDIDGSVYWIYDTEKNPRYTAMMQDYIKNHTNEEIMEYAVSLGIDPSIYLNTDESSGSEAPAIVGKSAFDAAEDKHPEVHQGRCQYATVGITEPEFDWIHSYNVQDTVIVNLSEQTVGLATYFSNGDGSYDGQYVHYGVDELIYYGPTLNYDDVGEIGRALYANG